MRVLNISKPDSQLRLICFYFDKNEGRIKGGCYIKINSEDLWIESKKINKLPLEVYQDLYGEKRGKGYNYASTEERLNRKSIVVEGSFQADTFKYFWICIVC